jgi:organic radical activating enzyme
VIIKQKEAAPETVHWAITYRCRQNCPDCYARRYQEQEVTELDTAGALQVVEKLAQWGVFQLAIGGGEPLQRSDLPLIARAAKDRGLVVHVTTGLIEDFDFKILEQLAPAIKSLHIGVKQDRLLAQPRKEVAHLRQIIQAADTLGVSTGANLFLCNTVLKHFGQIMENLVQAGFQRIILLRYKPSSDVNRWLSGNLPPETLENFNTTLEKIARLCPHFELRLDCALSFLQRNLSPQEALSAGLRG